MSLSSLREHVKLFARQMEPLGLHLLLKPIGEPYLERQASDYFSETNTRQFNGELIG